MKIQPNSFTNKVIFYISRYCEMDEYEDLGNAVVDHWPYLADTEGLSSTGAKVLFFYEKATDILLIDSQASLKTFLMGRRIAR